MTLRNSFFIRFIFCLFILFFTALLVYSEDSDTDIISREINDAMRLYEFGKIEIAIYLLQQIQEKYPDSEEVLMKLCEMALASKNWAYAIELLEGIAAVKPGDINVRHVLMDIYKAYQMTIQEIRTARDILNTDPDNLKALHRLTQLYHGQYMIREEEETRKKIARIDPGDQENLKQLAALYAEEGEVWKEIQLREMIYEKFPENSINKRRLAYLYGADKDLYQKLLILEHIRKESHIPRIETEYKKTKREYKKSLLLSDVFESYSALDVLKTVDEWVFTYTEGLFHKTFALKSNSSIELHLGYSGMYNVPEDNTEERYHLGKTTLGGTYQITSYNDKTNFSLILGVDNINIFEMGTGVSHPEYTSDFFIFKATENNSFFPFTGLNFCTELIQYLYLDLHFLSTHIENIASYKTPLRNNDCGAGLYLLFPDSTLFLIGCEMHWIWEELIRYRLTAETYYVLYAANSVYDYKGNRTGYYKETPDTQIDFTFNFELYNNADRIPFDSEKEINHNYMIILGLHQRFKELFILRIEGTGEISNTLDYAAGVNLGLKYQNLEGNVVSKMNLFYRYLNTILLSEEDASDPGHNFGIEFIINFNTY